MTSTRHFIAFFLGLFSFIFVSAQNIDSILVQTIQEEMRYDSTMATLPDSTQQIFAIDTTKYPFLGIDSLICFAESYLGTPYQYGSKGPNSFDCSGFVGYVFSHFNIQLPASSTAQYQAAPYREIDIDSAKQGDLIFFMGRNGRHSVGHVGLIVDVDLTTHSCRFIHAATHGGIILTNYPSTAYYNTRYMGIGRFEIPKYIK